MPPRSVVKLLLGVMSSLLCHSVLADTNYFPLTVGSKWSYRCSADGAFQFNKVLTIVSGKKNTEGGMIFRGEWKIGKDRKPLVVNYDVLPNGRVESFYEVEPGTREVVMVPAPAVGGMVGSLKIVGKSLANIKGFQKTTALRLENFPLDSRVDAVKRSAWTGRLYGENLGLMEESDGTGASCTLTAVDMKRPS